MALIPVGRVMLINSLSNVFLFFYVRVLEKYRYKMNYHLLETKKMLVTKAPMNQ